MYLKNKYSTLFFVTLDVSWTPVLCIDKHNEYRAYVGNLIQRRKINIPPAIVVQVICRKKLQEGILLVFGLYFRKPFCWEHMLL